MPSRCLVDDELLEVEPAGEEVGDRFRFARKVGPRAGHCFRFLLGDVSLTKVKISG